MIFDVNTYIGHWPFRQIRHNNAKTLLDYLNESGISKACISSVNAIFYKDSMEGNRELIKEISPYGDKFVPFGIINPAYTNWKEDFEESIENLQIRGLELYPYYHNYKLTDPEAMELIQMAISNNIIIHLPCAVVNIRQRHWMDTMENLKINELENVLSEFDDGNFIISNGSTNEIAQQLSAVSRRRRGRVLYDFARVEVFNGGIKDLLSTAGTDNVVYGSVAPFQYIEPQSVKLEYADISTAVFEKITHKNLEGLVSQ